jgi:hypothetical protein
MPSPFPLLSCAAGNGYIRHPGVFACYSQIFIGSRALKEASQVFIEEAMILDPPSFDGESVQEEIGSILLEHIFNPTFEMPNPAGMFSRIASESTIHCVRDSLIDWIGRVVDELRSPHALQSGKIDPTLFLMIIRAFCFVASSGLAFRSAKELYDSILNMMSATAMFRYSRLVLAPLVHAIHQERGKHIPNIRALTSDMLVLVRCFNHWWPAVVAEDLKVSVMTKLFSLCLQFFIFCFCFINSANAQAKGHVPIQLPRHFLNPT